MKNLVLVFVAFLSLAAVGCKKKSGGADCTAAINHSMDLSKDEMAKMGTDAAMIQKMKDLGVQHCKDDKWGDDAVKCMVDAKTMAEAQACYGKLTQEQRIKMNTAVMELAAPKGSDAGSAAMAGSDTGSAAMAGSDTAGSDTGSAGSAAGSAGSAM